MLILILCGFNPTSHQMIVWLVWSTSCFNVPKRMYKIMLLFRTIELIPHSNSLFFFCPWFLQRAVPVGILTPLFDGLVIKISNDFVEC
jgi:hypothetical protein